jgi:hypothetical protein
VTEDLLHLLQVHMDVISPLHLAGASWTLATSPLARDAVVARVDLLVQLEMALEIIEVVEHGFKTADKSCNATTRATMPTVGMHVVLGGELIEYW